jgi:hypothetical protein
VHQGRGSAYLKDISKSGARDGPQTWNPKFLIQATDVETERCNLPYASVLNVSLHWLCGIPSFLLICFRIWTYRVQGG